MNNRFQSALTPIGLGKQLKLLGIDIKILFWDKINYKDRILPTTGAGVCGALVGCGAGGADVSGLGVTIGAFVTKSIGSVVMTPLVHDPSPIASMTAFING